MQHTRAAPTPAVSQIPTTIAAAWSAKGLPSHSRSSTHAAVVYIEVADSGSLVSPILCPTFGRMCRTARQPIEVREPSSVRAMPEAGTEEHYEWDNHGTLVEHLPRSRARSLCNASAVGT